MGSVQSEFKCPNCGNEHAIDDYRYKTGEFNRFCRECGYNHSLYFKRDKEGNIIKIDENKGKEFENLEIEEIEIKAPYGIYEIEMELGSELGTLETEDDYNNFKHQLLIPEDEKVKTVIVRRYSKNRNSTEIIYKQ